MTPPFPESRRPRLALPFTVLSDRDAVRLVAGEDVRYALEGPSLEAWLPALLARLDGRTPVARLLAGFDPALRDHALGLLDRLYGERVLIDGSPAEAHEAVRVRVVLEGEGALRAALERAIEAARGTADGGGELRLLCQDRLDYDEALRFNRRNLDGPRPWLWATCGPMQRGFVGPPFLPDVGPCLACVVRGFRMLSPAPDVYDRLIRQARSGLPIARAEFSRPGLEILAQIALWKSTSLALPKPGRGVYRLHVLELDEMEVTTHRVFADPECPECGGRR